MGCSGSATASREQDDVEAPDFHDKYTLGVKLCGDGTEQYRFASKRDGAAKYPVATDAGQLWQKSVKIIELVSDATKTQHEITIWKLAGDHPNCVQLGDVFYGKSLCFAVTERCTKCFIEHLDHMSEITEKSLGGFFLQMLAGISHLHNMNVVHRDVKPEAFLIGDCGLVKLSDFGSSVVLSSDEKSTGAAGTAPYICPEMLLDQYHDYQADVWSFGVIAYALLFGCFPYAPMMMATAAMMDTEGMLEAIRAGSSPQFKVDSDEIPIQDERSRFRTLTAVDFAKKLLVRCPGDRLSATQALGTDYLAAVKADRHSSDVNLKPMFSPSFRRLLRWKKDTESVGMSIAEQKLQVLVHGPAFDGSTTPVAISKRLSS